MCDHILGALVKKTKGTCINLESAKWPVKHAPLDQRHYIVSTMMKEFRNEEDRGRKDVSKRVETATQCH